MNFLDILVDESTQLAMTSRIYGVVISTVTNNQDPDNLGRIKVTFPWLNDRDEGYWARLATPMAGDGRGIYFLPEVHDEVLVIFEHGDVRFPYIIGALWNGQGRPPTNNNDGKNNIRLIKSRSGHLIRLDDTNKAERIEIIDKSGKNRLVFDTQNNTITINSAQDLTLSARNGTLKLEAKSIELDALNTLKVSTNSQADIEARGVMNIKGQVINLN
ncbi:phage tail protein [Scytonema hofmannii PCC 7110]|uniref:Phage tail protein n=1 Tax=Scytonema hofmannii PCC 7110 TaxID=128403 RepID=A0A139XG39_9CYAN|nr:phage baseplate assembly protein V [Scytonema hofmannii]KYC43639.1 phage tail protein [Scytonema hofmannii PCC 7110]